MIESPSHMPNKRSALLDFSAYQRLDAKKALIGITHVAYLSTQTKKLGKRNWTNEAEKKNYNNRTECRGRGGVEGS